MVEESGSDGDVGSEEGVDLSSASVDIMRRAARRDRRGATVVAFDLRQRWTDGRDNAKGAAGTKAGRRLE